MRNVWDFREIGMSKMLFSDATAEYMADKDKRLRATTLEGYRSAIRCHLMPMWGKREIESISFEEVQDWVDGFVLAGAAEKAYKTFRQIYRWVLRRHQLRIWDVTQGVVRRGICYLSVCCGGAWNVGSIGATAKQVAVLPEGARPAMPVECWSRKPGGGDTTMYVQADGKIMAMSGSSTTYFRGYAVFPVA